jgi:peptidoglycan/LPS O-acetylase OafA/YrhL
LPGGFLGVDMFMVVSGFIVTRLLLREFDGSGRIRVGAFWGRRFRRLVPALAFMLLVVSLWARAVVPSELLPSIREQALSALTYSTNWRLIAQSLTYGGAAANASPFVHLWSLAVEEQFYLLWPLVLIPLIRMRRGRRDIAIVVTAAAAIASAAWMAARYQPGQDPLRLYYGTDTRAHTFLIGALAALAAPYARRWATAAVRWLAIPLLIALIVAMRSDHPDVLYRGGFAVVALATAMVVLAVAHTGGPGAWLLDRGPFRAVGRVSYGIYLWHWPAIALLTPARLGFGGLALAAVRLGVTAAGAVTSWFVIERPFAHWRPQQVARRATVAIAGAAAALLLLPSTASTAFADMSINHLPAPQVAAPTPRPKPVAARRRVAPSKPRAKSQHRPTARPAAVATTSLVLAAHGTVMIVGDSGMYSATPALVPALQDAGWRVVQTSYPGMGLTQPADVLSRWYNSAAEYHVDLTIVMIGSWDAGWLTNHGSNAYTAVVANAFSAFTHTGGDVLWLSVMPGGDIDHAGHLLDPFYEHITALHPRVAQYLDIGPALVAPGGGWPQIVGGHRLRGRDGWHLCQDGAAALTQYIVRFIRLDTPYWNNGSWRQSPNYFDPPNACTLP